MPTPFQPPKSFAPLRRILKDEYTRVKKRLVEMLQGLDCRPSIATDVWTARGTEESYLGATLYGVRKGKYIQVFLGVRAVQDHRAGKRLADGQRSPSCSINTL